MDELRDTQYNLPIGTDCISRQQAIGALEKDMASIDQIIKGMSAIDVRLDAYVSQRNQVVYDIDTIKQLPPIQPKRGKWERHYSRPNVYADLFWHCSECGYRSSDNWADKFNFCPHCGADMRGEQDG